MLPSVPCAAAPIWILCLAAVAAGSIAFAAFLRRSVPAA
jgi:hypothetical protein